MSTPSEFQLKIYKHFRIAELRQGKGKSYNAVISAGAGSGKSTTLRAGIHEIKLKYPKARILSLQFNKHIKEEMEAKLGKIDGVDIMTSHASGLSVLKANGYGKCKVNSAKYYMLSKTYIENNAINKIIRAFAPPTTNGNLPSPDVQKAALIKAFSQLTELVKFTLSTKTDHTDHQSILNMIDRHSLDIQTHEMLPMITAIVTEGVELVRTNRALSFEDMICCPTLLGCKFPHYDWVLVDEAQDLNAAQLELVMQFGANGKCMAFGDRRQAIMGWAGAMSDGMDKFKSVMNARELPLNVCYRCAHNILELARCLNPDIMDRPGVDEGVVACTTKQEVAMQAMPGDYVLCRLTAPLVSMCIGFIKIGKAARVKGKDIGKKLVDIYDAIASMAEDSSIDSFISAFSDFRLEEEQRAMKKKLTPAKVAAMTDEHDCISAIASYIAEKNPTGVTPHRDIRNQILNLFDDEITKDFVMLCTIHRSKGLEAKRIFIIDFHKMPFKFGNKETSADQYLQEINLIYVAVTRAMNELYIESAGMFQSVKDIHCHLSNLTFSDSRAIIWNAQPTPVN